MADNTIDHDYNRRRLAVGTVRDAINNLNIAITRAGDACDGTPDALAFWEFRKTVAALEGTDQFRALLALSVRGADVIKAAPQKRKGKA